MTGTRRRKADHVDVVLKEDVEFEGTGLDCVALVHEALPEINEAALDIGVDVLDKRLDMPLMISGMTGGFKGARKWNRLLASAAQRNGLGFGLGSMRAMIEDPNVADTYMVREQAPDILLVGNIGLPQLLSRDFAPVFSAMEEVDVDAVAIHLNALQEVAQPEGEVDFRGGLETIEEFVSSSHLPVIVKETGGGISSETARSLASVGVEWIDTGGCGGTSFAAVEAFRASGVGRELAESLGTWGIPTAASVLETTQVEGLRVIASGGIRNGIDVVKALALGANCAGMASPFLKAAVDGEEGLNQFIDLVERQIRASIFLTGSRQMKDLGRENLFIGGWLRDWIRDRGLEADGSRASLP